MTYILFLISIVLITVLAVVIKKLQRQELETSIALQRAKEVENKLKHLEQSNNLAVQDKINQLNVQIKALKDEQNKLQQLNVEKENTILVLRKEAEQENKDFEQVAQAGKDLAQRDESIGRLDLQIKALQDDQQHLQQLNLEKENTITMLRKEVEQKSRDFEQVEQARQESAKQDQLIRRLNTQVEGLQDERTRLQQLNEEKEEIAQKLYDEIEDEIEEKTKEQKKRIEELEKELANVYNSFGDIQGQNLDQSGDVNAIKLKALERDLYPNERLDILITVLKDSLNNVHENSRRNHIISDVISNNNISSFREDFKEEIQHLFRDYKSMNSRLKQSLQRMGFEIVSDNSNYKIIFHHDGRYTICFAKTPSDWRAGRNIARDIRNLIL